MQRAGAVSLALIGSETVSPSLLVWSPGLTMVTVPAALTVQVNDWLAVLLRLSVAVTVTE